MWNTLRTLLCGRTRLELGFPWTMQTASKHYFIALVYFALGSFVAPMLVLAPVFALANYPALLLALVNPFKTFQIFSVVWLIGAALGVSIYRTWLKRRNRSLDFTRHTRAAYMAIGCGLLADCLFAWSLYSLDRVFPQVIGWVADLMSEKNGSVRVSFVMWFSLISFVSGFALQIRYIADCLRKDGSSLSQAMAINLDQRRGSWWGATAFNTVWPVILAYLLWQPLGELVVYFMGPAHQNTIELAQSATGGNFVLFALMAAAGAPIFEEIVFRGFLLNIIRCCLRQDLVQPEPVAIPDQGKLLWVRRYLADRRNKLDQLGYRVWLMIHSALKHTPELAGVIISSLLFSLLHLQFNPTTLVLLFLLGCIHAELYRRTGSLYCSILLHALNNGIEVFKLGAGG